MKKGTACHRKTTVKSYKGGLFSMKLVLPKEHGAWAMWIAPFLIGTFATQFQWYHPILFVAIFFAYISISPFIQGLKRSVERKETWTIAFKYLGIATILGAPFLYYFPRLFFIVLAIIPFFLVNLYFAKQKRERALLNDLSAMIALTSTIFIAFELSGYSINQSTIFLWIANILFFFGSALYVKTLFREKQNLTFRWLAYLYMLGLPIVAYLFFGWSLAFAFIFSTIRGLFTSKQKPITPKTVGIIEIINTIWFMIFLLLTYNLL